ncbi:hypothetical protein Aduo_015564 [Ancylostoma duodenale]
MSAITILLMICNTAAILVMLVLLGIVVKNEKKLRGSRHRGGGSIAPAVNNKTVRVFFVLVTVFVCTWYSSVASVLFEVTLNLKLPRELEDDFVMLSIIPALVAYSQDFFGLYVCPRYSPVLRQQVAWLKNRFECGTPGSEIDERAPQTVTKNSTVRVPTVSSSDTSV